MCWNIIANLQSKTINSSLNFWTNDEFVSVNGFCFLYQVRSIICESEIDRFEGLCQILLSVHDFNDHNRSWGNCFMFPLHRKGNVVTEENVEWFAPGLTSVNGELGFDSSQSDPGVYCLNHHTHTWELSWWLWIHGHRSRSCVGFLLQCSSVWGWSLITGSSRLRFLTGGCIRKIKGVKG